MEGNILSSLLQAFKEIGQHDARSKSMQLILFISLAIFVIGIIICILFISRTYESRLLKCVSSFNKYFKRNPNITEENLVEVNARFKRVPKVLRYSWQEYMLNRDRQPSEYINTVSCIDQPTKSSVYKNITNTILLITIMVSVLTTLANFVCVYGSSLLTVKPTESNIGLFEGLFEILCLPLIYLFVGLFVVAFLKLYESSRYADLYYEFHEFERYLNKACSTMPAYVDYEVLFTPKEIRDAIPVLEEYLEKRALQEQKAQEEQEMNTNHFEHFNFDPVGVESAILLDRAMLEGEKYFNVRRTLTERINAREQEKFNYQKNFDEVTKDFERKSQAVRESLASITEQLNATSVKIEANYLKKRYNEEQQKQQQLEKDYEYAKINFTKQQQEMENEINLLHAEVKAKKTQVEENMMSECRNYSNKVWGEINKTIHEQQDISIKELEVKIKHMQEELDRMVIIASDQDNEIRSKQDYILKLEGDIRVKVAEIEAINNVRNFFTSTEFKPMNNTQVNSIAQVVSEERGQEEMSKEQDELISKLKEVNQANSEYNEQIQEINERKANQEEEVKNPFAEFTDIQRDIERETTEFFNNQNDLAESVDNTIKVVEESKEENVQAPVIEAGDVVTETPVVEEPVVETAPAIQEESADTIKARRISSIKNKAKAVKRRSTSE